MPLARGPSPEVDEVDPEDLEGLKKEIRSHDLNDIPHKNEHLVSEDEEYSNDEPDHHVEGRPPGYENYDVVDETDPRDLEVFEVAERDHGGIEGDRTTEQLTIQEMELRQQPGAAVRAVSKQHLVQATCSTVNVITFLGSECRCCATYHL